MSHSEIPRQLVHIGAGGFALLFAWLRWPQAAAMAGSAVVFNLLILPRLGTRVFRAGDLDRPWTSGIVLYPLAVLGLVLLFRDRLDLAAAAWGILAAGDGMATLVGTTIGSPRLPWNRDKSVAGLVAFLLAASVAAVGLLAWTSDAPVTAAIVVAGVVTASVAGFVETIPIRLDDNVSVPAAAAFVLWSSTYFDPQVALARESGIAIELAAAVLANGAIAGLGLLAGTVTAAGALTGVVIGTVIVLGGGWAAWGVLLATFVTASVCTRIGAARKTAAGIAEARGGRRGPGNAIANTGLAAWVCLIAIGMPDPTLALLACVAALATAGSDTVASEIGKAYGRITVGIASLRRVAPGTTGAVSLEGTAAGVVSAAGLAALGAWWGLVPWMAVPVVTIAATVASLAEGVLGATLEARGILNNDTLNFLNAAMGAALTLAAWVWWPR
jgi:uncharacterized protein (TIGR00297 family)